jgi:lambda family phage tail tape measure protein
MTIDVSTLQLVVDSRQVKAAKDDLAALAVQGKETEASLGGINKAAASGLTGFQAQINEMVGGYAELTTASDAYKNAEEYAAKQAADQRTSMYRRMFDQISAQEKEANAASIARQKEINEGLKELAREEAAEKAAIQKAAAQEQAAIQARQLADEEKVKELRIAMYRNMFDEIDARAAESEAAQVALAEKAAAEQRAIHDAKYAAIAGSGAVGSTVANDGYPETAGYTYSPAEQAAMDQSRLDSLAVAEAYRARGKAATEASQVESTASTVGAKAAKDLESEVGRAADGIKNKSRIISDASSGLSEALTGQFGRTRRSIAGIVNATGVLNGLFTPIGLGLLAVGAGVAAVTAAEVAGEKQQDSYNTSLRLTGEYAGLSEDAMLAFARSLTASNVSIGTSIETLGKLASSGRFTKEQIELIAPAVVQMAARTNASVDETIAIFDKLADDPVRGLINLDKQYHFLTISVLDHVRALQEQGSTQEAVTAAIDSATSAIGSRLDEQKENVGNLAEAWRGLKNWISEATQAMESWGKHDTSADSQILTLLGKNQELVELRDAKKNSPFISNSGVDEIQKEIDANNVIIGQLRKKAAAEDAATAAKSAESRANSEAAQAEASLHEKALQYNREARKEQELNDANSKYNIALKGKDADPDKLKQEYDETVAGINQRYKPRGAGALNSAQQNSDVGTYKSQLADIAAQEKSTFATLAEQRNSYAITSNDFFVGQVEAIIKWHDATVSNLQSQEEAIKRHMGTGAAYINSQNRLKTLDGELAKADTEYTTQLVKATDERNKARDKETASLARFEAAIKQELDAKQRQIDSEVRSVSMSSKDAGRANEIDDIYSSQARKEFEYVTENTDKAGTEGYKKRIADIRQETLDMISKVKAGYSALDTAQATWQNGAIAGFREWAQSGLDEAGLMKTFVMDSFDTMSASILEFATTGKTSVKGMVASILTDFAKMELRVAESKILSGIIGAFFGGGSDGAGGTMASIGDGAWSGSANGNVFSGSSSLSAYSGSVVSSPTFFAAAGAPQAYASGGNVMGEAGPEGIFPLQRGADGKLGVKATGGTGDINITVATTVIVDSNGNAKSQTKVSGADNKGIGKAVSDELNKAIDDRIRTLTRPGGYLWQVKNGQVS